jgi:glycosyltransferase involved in cell wall biosynthesis
MTQEKVRRANIAILVPTFNEEINVERNLASVVGWAQEVFVLDSLSKDGTLGVVAKFPEAKVFEHAFEGYSKQWNWAIDNLPWTADWIMLLAADEYLSAECKADIEQAIADAERRLAAGDGAAPVGFFLNRKLIMFDTWLRFGGPWPSWHMRIWRRGRGRYEERSVNEHLKLDGASAYLKEAFIHDDRKGLTEWLARHNKYSTFEAIELVKGEEPADIKISLFGNQPERKRFLRYRVWNHLPMRPLLWFLYSYIFRLGFLHGRAGYRYARLGEMYQYWQDLKVEELQDAARARGLEARKAAKP